MLKISFSTLSYFQNWRTFVVSFLLEPIFGILMITLLSAQFSSANAIKSVVAMTAISGIQMLLNSLSALFVGDQMRGIAREVAVVAPYSIRYWFSKIIVAIIVALGQTIVILTLIIILTHDISWLTRAVIILLPMMISGTIVSFVAVIASWQKEDPYLVPNIINTVIVLLSGVIVPISQYPNWLAFFANILPFSHSIEWLTTGNGQIYPDFIIAAVWLTGAIILYLWKLNKIKQKLDVY
ncbi:MAG: ABC transporter permease [Lactobacillaceae bacterium]|jgi:ABC-2 type transport system permease protein|nr:ABC transporter permease [Lactobacillaceae bacterium]